MKPSDANGHPGWMRAALQLAADSARNGGGPFGALVVRDGAIIGEGVNRVTQSLDPTAHAEVQAIRSACQRIGDFRLTGALLYASCMPCPMCYAASYWARIERVYFAADAQQAAQAGFDDLEIAATLALAPNLRAPACHHLQVGDTDEPFRIWRQLPQRIEY